MRCKRVCAHVFVQLELQAHKNQPAGHNNNKLIWYSLLLWLQVVHHWQCQLFSHKLRTLLTNFSMWKNLSYLLQKYLFSSQKFSNTNKSGRKNWAEQSACDQQSNWGRPLFLVIGPSGVRALTLAAGINVGGHYKWHFFLFLSLFLSLFLPAHC